MRGYRTLRGRFRLEVPESAGYRYVTDITVGNSFYSVLAEDTSITLEFIEMYKPESGHGDRSRQTLGSYNMTIPEAERLINFLDTAILEHKARLTKRLERETPEDDQ